MPTNDKPADMAADINAIRDDVLALKRDLAALTAHLRSGATEATKEAAESLSVEARRLYDALAAQSKSKVELVGHRVEEQPLASVLIAFGLGFVISRVLSR